MTVAAPDRPLTEEEIALLAREKLAPYAHVVHGLLPAAHHEPWVNDLEAVDRGEIDRLLLLAPPGAAKTTWIRMFMEWYLGRHPSHSLLLLTTNDNQAHKFGTPLQQTLEGNAKYRRIFGLPENRIDGKRGNSITGGIYLAGIPLNEKDPSFQALSYKASALGNRANLIVLDDPLTQDDNNSDIEMPKAREAFIGTVMTRLKRGQLAAIVGIMTSWNESDFAHFLAEMFLGKVTV